MFGARTPGHGRYITWADDIINSLVLSRCRLLVFLSELFSVQFVLLCPQYHCHTPHSGAGEARFEVGLQFMGGLLAPFQIGTMGKFTRQIYSRHCVATFARGDRSVDLGSARQQLGMCLQIQKATRKTEDGVLLLREIIATS